MMIGKILKWQNTTLVAPNDTSGVFRYIKCGLQLFPIKKRPVQTGFHQTQKKQNSLDFLVFGSPYLWDIHINSKILIPHKHGLPSGLPQLQFNLLEQESTNIQIPGRSKSHLRLYFKKFQVLVEDFTCRESSSFVLLGQMETILASIERGMNGYNSEVKGVCCSCETYYCVLNLPFTEAG